MQSTGTAVRRWILVVAAGLAAALGGFTEWEALSSAVGGPAPLPQATFGGGITRNMVNLVDRNVPTTWSVEEGKFKNVKWVAELGSSAHSTPVIFDGRVFAATNNDRPRNPEIKGNKAILMCFAAKDGAFLWQNVHEMPPEDVIHEGIAEGLCSTPTVEGDQVYYCAPAAEVICAKAKDGKIVWRYDMMKELKVFPCYVCACSPLVVGDMVYVVTGNGADGLVNGNTFKPGPVPAPKAPSFVALAKDTGKLVWQSNLPGQNIIEGQWSNPVYAEVKGKPQVIFGGGDGWLYSFEPKTGNLIWKFKCTPTRTEKDKDTPPYIAATPVAHEGRVYIAIGSYPGCETQCKIGHFFCLDITKTGDVSCKNENFDPKDPANKDSALIWHFGGLVNPPPAKGKGRTVQFSGTPSSAAVHDGLVWIAEQRGYLHCLDANTGQPYWEHDFKTAILGSPYWVDGKVYVCVKSGDCFIFEHGKKYQKPRSNDMDEALESTPVVSGGVLYIGTSTKVFALGAK